MKRTKEDKIFSDLIRLCHNFTCENCTYVDVEGQITHKTRNIHLSHFITRGNYQTRWDTRNGYCLCATCHHFFEGRPSEHTEFVKERIGQAELDLLVLDSNTIRKWTTQEKSDMYEFYTFQFNDVCIKRNNGNNKIIKPINYDRQIY